MAAKTYRFDLLRLFKNEFYSLFGWKFSDRDIRTVDSLLTQIVEHHVHDGAVAGVAGVPLRPTVTTSTDAGHIPANTRVFYKYTLLDARNNESAASDTIQVHTLPSVLDPAAPVLTTPANVSSALAGVYAYKVAGYTGDVARSQMTKASPAAVTIVVAGQEVHIALPRVESGCAGFHIFRKGPTDADFYYVTSVTQDVRTFSDLGFPSNPARTAPSQNTTNSSNRVTLTPVTFPSGYTLKWYRTYDDSDWERSLLGWNHGAIVDVGDVTTDGFPPVNSATVGSPSKIDLTDMANVQGKLPPVGPVWPYQLELKIPGTLATGAQPTMWICEFKDAIIVSARATLAIGSSPDVSPVHVDLLYSEDDGVSFTSAMPYGPVSIPIGQQISNEVLGEGYFYPIPIRKGTSLRAAVTQAGGGAHTDRDLTLTVLMFVRFAPHVFSIFPSSVLYPPFYPA